MYAATILKLVSRHLDYVDAGVRQRLASWPDRKALEAWQDEALDLRDAESALKLLVKILTTPMPPRADGSPQST